MTQIGTGALSAIRRKRSSLSRKRVLRQHLVGDVDIGADQAQRAAVAVALDLGDDADPAGLAVVRPDDAVFGRIVLALALQRIETDA